MSWRGRSGPRKAEPHEKKTLKPTRKVETYKDSGMHMKYTKNLYSRKEGLEILRRLEAEIDYDSPEDSTVKIQGETKNIKRQHVAHGDQNLVYMFSERTMITKPWTPLLREIKKKVEKHTGTKYNFVLINRYKNGDDRIGAHRDDEGDLVAGASIGGLSFGCPRDFILRHHSIQNPNMKPKTSIPKFGLYTLRLGHGSFVEMLDPTNLYWYHEIPARKKAGNNPRVSLTFRVMRPREQFEAAPPRQRIENLPDLLETRQRGQKKPGRKKTGRDILFRTPPPPPPPRGRPPLRPLVPMVSVPHHAFPYDPYALLPDMVPNYSVTGGNCRLQPMAPPPPPPVWQKPQPKLNPAAKDFNPGSNWVQE